VGWLLSYIGRYRKYYPADSRGDVWDEIPMSEGFAMIATAMSLDGWLQFAGVAIDGGYVKGELDRILKDKKP
jgi:hypothetical protein